MSKNRFADDEVSVFVSAKLLCGPGVAKHLSHLGIRMVKIGSQRYMVTEEQEKDMQRQRLLSHTPQALQDSNED